MGTPEKILLKTNKMPGSSKGSNFLEAGIIQDMSKLLIGTYGGVPKGRNSHLYPPFQCIGFSCVAGEHIRKAVQYFALSFLLRKIPLVIILHCVHLITFSSLGGRIFPGLLPPPASGRGKEPGFPRFLKRTCPWVIMPPSVSGKECKGLKSVSLPPWTERAASLDVWLLLGENVHVTGRRLLGGGYRWRAGQQAVVMVILPSL